MGLMLAAFVWGLAEATIFFIIPDVILTYIALQNIKKALLACLFALIGALIGGTSLYFWSLSDPATVITVLNIIPAINSEMIQEVERSLRQDGLLAMVLGPTQGIPYKIYASYASYAPTVGIGYLTFLLASIPARLMRFLAVTVTAWLVSKYVFGKCTLRQKQWILSWVWVLVYVTYFGVNPSG
ncbi:hypothetical protein [Risungbinella massiliensis]|uniref:hypothetical protein n=1 Tax=Risungbinella massiliensis TaxID=1329796 RepID=UPI00069B7346|nr:hypothetical protein [Risungbinella massiliensis]